VSTYDDMFTAMRAVVDEADARYAALEQSLSQSARDLTEAQTRVTEITQELATATGNLGDLITERTALNATIADRDATITVLRSRIAELEAGQAPVVDRAYRESLVPLYDTYIPGTLEDAALVTGVNPYSVGIYDPSLAGLVPVETTGNATPIQISTSTPAETFEGRHFKSVVVIGASLSGRTVTFRNCHFSGVNPAMLRSMHDSGIAIVSGRGSAVVNWTTANVIFEDCTFDCTWWKDAGLSEHEGWLHSAGLAGSRFRLERCLVRGFTDGINMTGAPGNADGQSKLEVYASRLGPNYYAYNIPAQFNPQAGGYTHSDGIQTNTGPGLKVRHSYLGGPRLGSAKPTWPGGTQMRDGGGNATFMLQGEPDSRYPAEQIRVRDIDIQQNWLAGGTSTVNLNYSQGNPLSVDEGNRVENNRIMMKIPGFNDISYYIRYREEMLTSVSGNVEWDPKGDIHGTGTLVTAHRVRNTGSGGDQQLGTFTVPA